MRWPVLRLAMATMATLTVASVVAIETEKAAAQESPQVRLDNFRGDLRGFQRRGAQLRGRVARFQVPRGPFCLPRDQELIANTKAALEALEADARQHAAQFNEFKSQWQNTLKTNIIIRTKFYETDLQVDGEEFWRTDVQRNNTMLQSLAAKRKDFDALVAAAQPCPQPQTSRPPPPPPVNPLAGLPRPVLPQIGLPVPPDYFCSFEDRQKWIDANFNPVWNQSWDAVTALRNYGAAIYRLRYESGPVDARMGAILEREDAWQKQMHKQYDDLRTKLLEIRNRLPVIDCSGRRPEWQLAGSAPNGAGAPTGAYAGIQLAGNIGDQLIHEHRASTGALTNELANSSAEPGAGIVAGYNFALAGNVFGGPYVSWDFYDQRINNNFTGGTFIGSTTNWVVDVGLKAGYAASWNAAIYGLIAASFLNEDQKINFGGPVTSDRRTIAGLSVGGGVEVRPMVLQSSGMPVALFAQYQHTWYEDAKLTMPAASPLFNYQYQRTNDTFKAGVIVYRN